MRLPSISEVWREEVRRRRKALREGGQPQGLEQFLCGQHHDAEQEHINALLAVYDQATDETLVYAERAGIHWNTSIDLGQHKALEQHVAILAVTHLKTAKVDAAFADK